MCSGVLINRTNESVAMNMNRKRKENERIISRQMRMR